MTIPTLQDIEDSKDAMDDVQSFTYSPADTFVDAKGTTRQTLESTGKTQGVIVFTTYDLLDAYTPSSPVEEKTSFKVTNDPTSNLNGYYHWTSGTAYIKDSDLAIGVIVDGDPDPVTGGTVFDYVAPLSTSLQNQTIVADSHGIGRYHNLFPNGELEQDPLTLLYIDKSVVLNGDATINDVFTVATDQEALDMGIANVLVLDSNDSTNRHFIHGIPPSSEKYFLTSFISVTDGIGVPDNLSYVGKNKILGDGINGTTELVQSSVDLGGGRRLHIMTGKLFAYDPDIETAEFWIGATNFSMTVGDVVYMNAFNYVISDVPVIYIETYWDVFAQSQSIYQSISDNNTSLIDFVSSKYVKGGEKIKNVNSVIGRFGSIGETPTLGDWRGQPGESVTHEENEVIESIYGHINVIRGTAPINTNFRPTPACIVNLVELAKVGIIPDDTTPPLISFKARIVKDSDIHNVNSVQIFYLFRYGISDILYNSSYDVLFNSGANTASYLGDGDSFWDHTVSFIDDVNSKGWIHKGVPLPATYLGEDLVDIRIVVIGSPLAGPTEIYIDAFDFAIVLGSELEADDQLFNEPDDLPKVYNIGREQLTEDLENDLVFKSDNVIKKINLQNSDKIVLLGDSYSASHYTQKDKSYLSRLSELSDWRFDNFSRSGDDYSEINRRILNDTPEYHSSLSFKDMGATYALLISFVNDISRTSDLTYFYDDLRYCMETAMANGAKPIISTEFSVGTGLEFSGLSSVAREYSTDFIDIMGNAKIFDVNRYPHFWGGSHPATRTNGLFYEPLIAKLNVLDRPKQSIKLYRKRPTFVVSNDNDLLFDNIQQRINKWQEISLGHHCLVDRLAPYYDRMVDITDFHGGFTYDKIDSEYLKLQNNEPVSFGEYALIEVILPSTSKNVNEIVLNITDASAEVYSRNAVLPQTYNANNKHQAFEVDAPISAVVGDTYDYSGDTFTVIGEVVDYDGTNLVICSGETIYSSGASDTVTRLSGTGPTSFTANLARYGSELNYYSSLLQPRGEWKQLTNVSGKITISSDVDIRQAMNYDKVVFMIKQPSGNISLTDIDVGWLGLESKSYKTKELLSHKSSSSQVLPVTTVTSLTGWTVIGSLTPTDAYDNVLPRDMTKMVEVSSSNKLRQSFPISNSRYGTSMDIVVWARYYPTEFIPDVNEGIAAVQYLTAPITSDTADYRTLSIQLDTGDVRKGIVMDELVGMHWKEVRVRIDNTHELITDDSVFLEIYCPDGTLEISTVEVWED